MKILVLDIETAPNLAHVWGLWNQNVGINQIMEASYILSWSAKFVDGDQVWWATKEHNGKHGMIAAIHGLLDAADAVVTYNGDKFDLPTLNKEMLELGFQPPSNYKSIDLLKTMRGTFNFPSNKLDYVSQALGLGKKVKHEGHELWIKCMNGDMDAWERMVTYNIQDVELTEKLYLKVRGWIKSHPNHNLYTDGGVRLCTNCGSDKVYKKGMTYTNAGMYQRFKCQNCGANMRGRSTKVSEAGKENLIVGAI